MLLECNPVHDNKIAGKNTYPWLHDIKDDTQLQKKHFLSIFLNVSGSKNQMPKLMSIYSFSIKILPTTRMLKIWWTSLDNLVLSRSDVESMLNAWF